MDEKMSNEEIAAEFESIFGSEEKPDDTPEVPAEDNEDTSDEVGSEEGQSEESSEEPEEDSSEEGEESGEEGSEEKPTESEQDKQKARQNYAFAEQRQQIKKQSDLIKGLGKLIGFDDKATVEEIGDKLKEVLLERESKEQGVSIDLLKRIERAEEILQENDRIKLEKSVTEGFADLIEEHNLSKEEVDEFTEYLIREGKNPMENANVDIHAEYLKLHWKDMLESAESKAVEKEQSRQKKASEKSGSKVPEGAKSDDGEIKVESVKDLDSLFDKVDL